MVGIFRIARAELIKIFKKPSIYIMGILLALVIVVSMFNFSPQHAYNYSVKITGSNVEQIYDVFKNETEPDSESTLNSGFYEANQLVNYYYNYNSRLIDIKNNTNEFVNQQQLLYTMVLDNVGHQTLANKFGEAKLALDDLINSYTNHLNLTNLSFYNLYVNSQVFEKYYNENTTNLGILNQIKEIENSVDITNRSDIVSYANAFRNNFLDQIDGITNEPISYMFNHFNKLVVESVNNHRQLSITSNTTTPLNAESAKLESYINSYNDLISSLTATNNTSMLIVMVSEDSIANATAFLNLAIDYIENKEGTSPIDEHRNLSQQFIKLDFSKSLTKIKNSFSPVAFNNTEDLKELSDLKNYLSNDITALRQKVLLQIDEYYNENAAEEGLKARNDMLKLISNYKFLSVNTEIYFENILTIKASNLASSAQINNYIGFANFNKYKLNEESVKIKYLFDNEMYANDHISTFSFNQNSGQETTFLDFMYYSLKISSIFIIIFAIIMASNIMAYEFDTGTIKLLAIRPFKRWKILFGKLLSVMFFVVIFVAFSTIISLLAGLASFPGFSLLPAIVVFNAKTTFLINPIILMLIFIVSIVLEILFYATISLALSTIFKSFSAAMSSSLLVLFVGYILNAMLVGTFWFAYIPFLNTDMFRFLGGSFASSGSVISMFINSPLLSVSNFYISIGIYTATLSLFLLFSYLLFRKRDI